MASTAGCIFSRYIAVLALLCAGCAPQKSSVVPPVTEAAADPDSLFVLADSTASQGKHLDALHLYQAALDIDPNHKASLRGCASLHELTNDPLKTFGGYGVVRVPDLQGLLRYICENGFEHHTAVNLSLTAAAVNEALGKYLGWEVYYHR